VTYTHTHTHTTTAYTVLSIALHGKNCICFFCLFITKFCDIEDRIISYSHCYTTLLCESLKSGNWGQSEID